MKSGQIKIWLAALIPIYFLHLGCASEGFNRGALKEQVGVTKATFDEKDIKEAYNKKPNLPKAFKLGVYFVPPKFGPGSEPQWRWTEQDKKLIESIGQKLKSQGLVSNVFPILDSITDGEDLKSLRLAAAKHQADALLIVRGAGEIDRYINKWGWSYILLFPTLFVPGSETETLFMVNATMWDVKNEYLYLTSEAESLAKETYVAAFGRQDKALFDEAKTQALTELKAELERMIEGTKL